MTEKELTQKFDIRIHTFDSEEFEDEDEAFYISELRTMFISNKIAQEDRVQVMLHELGHKGHLPHLYKIHREKYELQANRNMIHHLLKEELSDCDDHENFNYIQFMQKYKLKTIADEAMVKEELYHLANIV
ncbi:TPA: ImmA/IrrE family metallo-endopeptidase [Streptococcus suis]|nr:ImmA/IrrE family metallo-endopeptidase [Streptococcus suis]